MKKKLLAVAIVGAFASPLAFADTTIYGIADVSYQHDSKGTVAAKDYLVSGSWTTSRLGFKGDEDLGGGLKAIWQFETGLDVTTGGADDPFWQRTAMVGLAGTWGTLGLGRQYTQEFHAIAENSAYYLTLSGVNAIAQNQVRSSNAIQYTSPSFSGFKVGGTWGFGESTAAASTGSKNNGNYYDIMGSWNQGDFGAAVAYSNLKGEDALGSTNDKHTVIDGHWDNKTFGVYAGYQTRKADSAHGVVTAPTDAKAWWIQPIFRFGGRNEVGGVIAQNKEKEAGSTNGKSSWIGVNYRYLLSKQTFLYASWAQVKNDDSAHLAPFSYQAATKADPLAAGSKPNAFAVGLVHTF